MKIIHISDLHYPKTGSNLKKLVGSIIQHYQGVKKKPIIVLSGDIVETPKDSYYKKAKKILSQLLDHNFNLLICPGNHDLKKNGVLGSGKDNKFRFDQYYKGLLPQNSSYNTNENPNLLNFPIVNQYKNHFFIGLDSLAKKTSFARGQIGSSQMLKLKNIINNIRTDFKDSTIIIYLHHHPLKFRLKSKIKTKQLRLKDRYELLNTIRGVDVLLFGHLHWNERYTKEEKQYNIKCIQLAGGCTHIDADDTMGQIDWLEINTKTFTTKTIRY